jgi:copper chaperone
MRQSLNVKNVMCDGCAGTIAKTLSAMDGIGEVAVDIPTGTVAFEAATDRRVEVAGKLAAIGYPERASGDDLAAMVAKAKSWAGNAPREDGR